MSLINQVLLDLDRRHAGDRPMSPAARSVSAPPRVRLVLRSVGALLVIGAGVGIAMAASLAMPAASSTPGTSTSDLSKLGMSTSGTSTSGTSTSGTSKSGASPATAPSTRFAAIVAAPTASDAVRLPEVTVTAPPAPPTDAPEVTSTLDHPTNDPSADASSRRQPGFVVTSLQPKLPQAAPPNHPATWTTPDVDPSTTVSTRVGLKTTSPFMQTTTSQTNAMSTSTSASASTSTSTSTSTSRSASAAPAVPTAMSASVSKVARAAPRDDESDPVESTTNKALPGPKVAPLATPQLPSASRLESRVEKKALPLSSQERAEAEYQRALGLHQQGRNAEAKLAFASALREDRRHSSARQALAVVLVGEGRLDEVEVLLAEGLALNPHDTTLAATLARVKAEQQDLGGAIAVLRTALPLAPMSAAAMNESPDARALLATLQQRAGRHADAIDNYSAALRAVPGNGAWWIGLGISLAADGRADQARAAFSQARTTESLSAELARFVDQRLAANAR